MANIGRKKILWSDFENDFNYVIKKYSLDKTKSVKELSDELLELGNQLQGEICGESDSIKYDGLKTANGLLAQDLSKGDWLNMVQIGVRTTSPRANSEKIEGKIDENISRNAFVNDFNNSLKSNVSSGNISSIAVPEASSYIGNIPTKEIPAFTELYNTCVETRTHINKVLYKEYGTLARAFEYLYKGELTRADYKMLVDDIHYANGGYPSDNTPARTWSKIHSFDRLVNALTKAGKVDYLNDYLSMFGLKVERINDNSYTKWNGNPFNI